MLYLPRQSLAKVKGDSLLEAILHAASYESKFESMRWVIWVSWREPDLESWGWKVVGFIYLCQMNTLHQHTRATSVTHLYLNCESCSPTSLSLQAHFLYVKSLETTWTLWLLASSGYSASKPVHSLIATHYPSAPPLTEASSFAL